MMRRMTIIAFAAIMAAIATAEVGVSVDFGKVVAPFRPALHSAGFSPWYGHVPMAAQRIRELGFLTIQEGINTWQQ